MSSTLTQQSPTSERGDGRWVRARQAYLRRAPAIIATIASLLGLLALVDAVWVRERDRVHAITRILPVPASAAATAVIAVKEARGVLVPNPGEH